jgi:elongation factor P
MAEMVDTNSFKNGMHIDVEGTVWRIVSFQHHKPGKGGAVMRTKLKNTDTGAVVDKTFRAGEKFPRILTDQSNAQFLYSDGEGYHFMDPETFDQVALPEALLGEQAAFLQEGMVVQILRVGGEPKGVELPTTVERKVIETEPAVRGDTVGNVLKAATVEGGAEVKVPSFVAEGDVLKIDTRDGSYISRV